MNTYSSDVWAKFTCHFVCPNCGSSYFGSSQNIDETVTRHCHGFGCNFEWHESQDDKYLYVLYTDVHKLLRKNKRRK